MPLQLSLCTMNNPTQYTPPPPHPLKRPWTEEADITGNTGHNATRVRKVAKSEAPVEPFVSWSTYAYKGPPFVSHANSES